MIPFSTNAALYGKGVFTTVAVDDGELFLWEKHWLRLISDAAKLDIDTSNQNAAATYRSVHDALAEFGSKAGRVRVSFLDGKGSERWGGGTINTELSLLVGEKRETLSELRLTVSRHLVNSTSPLAGIKSCNYLEPLMSFQEAKKHGFNEAIRLNERGEITSACMANVFWLTAGRLYTPSLKTTCLAGTTREYVLENLECEEVEIGIEALHEADEIFLTSAGIGVVQVSELDGRKLRRAGHPIMGLLPF